MIYLNNRIVPKKKALISVYDHGFLYGDGIYETMRAYNRTVFMIDEHIRRLFTSASMISLETNKTPAEIKKAVYDLMHANRLKDAVIRITLSRGPGPVGLDPDLCLHPTFVVFASRFRAYPEDYYREGVPVIIAETRRNFRLAVNPAIKSLNFLNNILAKIEAKKTGAFESIMLNSRGYVAEGTISNVFFIRDGVLHTPSPKAGILRGITRDLILQAAASLNIPVREGLYRADSLRSSGEVFLSNTTTEVLPVSAVDGKRTGRAPGKSTRKLHEAYRQIVADYIRENPR
jgi:branched-chain amino acid aminotransferase